MKLAVNFVAFQLGWFACVLGAANALPWVGPLAVLGIVALHLLLARRPVAELKLVLVAMLMGLLLDSALLATGWLSYPSGMWLSGAAPYWIIAMWGLFATTLNVSMSWLRNRLPLAVGMGAVGGPLSYLAGEKLGGIELTQPVSALAALAVAWAVAMPLLAWLAARLDGVSEPERPDFVTKDWRVSHRA